ncbi:N-acetylmuramate alpha-1-phosphate uridylyltransferase MurU [Pseudoalteromonas piratica]|uniref:Mannose-1-phosphate guanylyltransferase n=1 Tax=Pseudoalteromonas piratica TaxID=1348114 RepID=A0A0A7EFF1_9GAMM|nr:nucleotidyltransferase family protein [Pseudoalteromonas piratica]AIY64786.1 mannose-1-phosphate guanylyltransferase [Pseudoalteromonas piratica]
MKAMILAAGRGKRMMPLTEHMPKPMLTVNGKPLIQYHIERLANAGITEIVINLAWCGDVIRNTLGDGSEFGVNLIYSDEGGEGLETAGGILNALHLLSDTFIVINGDIYTDYDVSSLTHIAMLPHQAHLVLVENPEHNPRGDFSIVHGFAVSDASREDNYTFAGIALYHKSFFAERKTAFLPLAPMLREKMVEKLVTAELYIGNWYDIGTPERLAEINRQELIS